MGKKIQQNNIKQELMSAADLQLLIIQHQTRRFKDSWSKFSVQVNWSCDEAKPNALLFDDIRLNCRRGRVCVCGSFAILCALCRTCSQLSWTRGLCVSPIIRGAQMEWPADRLALRGLFCLDRCSLGPSLCSPIVRQSPADKHGVFQPQWANHKQHVVSVEVSHGELRRSATSQQCAHLPQLEHYSEVVWSLHSRSFIQQHQQPPLVTETRLWIVHAHIHTALLLQGSRPSSHSSRLNTDWLTDWPTVGLTDCWTDWLTDRLSDWLTDCLTNWLADWLTDWLTDWLSDCLTDLLTDCLTDWLSDWLTKWKQIRFCFLFFESLFCLDWIIIYAGKKSV